MLFFLFCRILPFILHVVIWSIIDIKTFELQFFVALKLLKSSYSRMSVSYSASVCFTSLLKWNIQTQNSIFLWQHHSIKCKCSRFLCITFSSSYTSVMAEKAMSVWQSVHYCDLELNILMVIYAVKFGTDIHDTQAMKLTDFIDPLTFSLAPPWGWHWWFWVNNYWTDFDIHHIAVPSSHIVL